MIVFGDNSGHLVQDVQQAAIRVAKILSKVMQADDNQSARPP
jgi:hypothetical protein